MYNQLYSIIDGYAQELNLQIPKIKIFNPINLEVSFNNDFQRELFNTIQVKDTLSNIKTKNYFTKSGISLKLLNGGKINHQR